MGVKYQPLPKNTSIVDAIVDLGMKMGAELAAARAQIEELTAKVDALSKAMKFQTTDTLNEYEKSLVHKGLLIDAIKAFRARVQASTGEVPGLKESKDLVEAYKHSWQMLSPPFNPLNPPPLLDEHKQMLKAGDKINAIKAYREYTKTVCSSMAGLKESKDMCDAYLAYLNGQ